MRVVGGTLRGRSFDAPKNRRTHPMSEKARGGLFNILGDVAGLTFLDAFAGSGALGIEALSRGAANVTAVELDKRAFQTLKRNIEQLNVGERLKAIHANVSGWSDNNPDQQYDVLIAAPPYDHLQLTLLQKLTRHVKADGIYVLDWPGKVGVPEFAGLQLLKTNNYGDAQLVFYRPLR